MPINSQEKLLLFCIVCTRVFVTVRQNFSVLSLSYARSMLCRVQDYFPCSACLCFNNTDSHAVLPPIVLKWTQKTFIPNEIIVTFLFLPVLLNTLFTDFSNLIKNSIYCFSKAICSLRVQGFDRHRFHVILRFATDTLKVALVCGSDVAGRGGRSVGPSGAVQR